ncbi:hypothetical protein SAMD00019534_025490 [Acytostelium subglobosum LB1]|uniref:hypothetical protein n=1 Tax=Acytostelium subglobosum LB1 TaxID=1410327 RepID=UPI000645170D|nr:hypothetical protein SAMD00019534_025490 [Acytostelium subglobosum LB1]GAM19374.1 hypothetical protein SAMD00019534_025490 [Acytostelium subglobosum LB1]|eukprot:XP_012757301.1 hypothetical protein SAMD00019534_025490 [Acytostelium subglobosum LB1]
MADVATDTHPNPTPTATTTEATTEAPHVVHETHASSNSGPPASSSTEPTTTTTAPPAATAPTTTTTTTTTAATTTAAPAAPAEPRMAHGLPLIDPQPHHAVNGVLIEPLPMPLTIVDGLENTVLRYPHNLAIQVKRGGKWTKWTWAKYREDIYSAAKSFIKLGLREKEGINIIGFNSPEWHLSHLGAIFAGGVPTGIYSTSSSTQCEYFVQHSEAAFVCVENEQQLAKYTSIRDRIPTCRGIIIMEPTPVAAGATATAHGEGIYTWEQFMELGRSVPDSEVDRLSKAIKPDDLCTLIYTSGTTGMPKGCMITHRNVSWTVHTLGSMVLHPQRCHRERFISYLPLSHIAEQVVTLYAPMLFGFNVSFADRDALQGTLLDTLMDVKPTVFFGVPRVWEKIQLKISLMLNQGGFVKKKLLSWARGKGIAGGYSAQRGEKKPMGYGLARSLVFKKVLGNLGLSNCWFMASTAAPISKDTLEFFMSLGITITEAYGMSELTGPQTIGYPKVKTGSIGKTLPGSFIKLNEGDNEICVKGPNCFAGYYKNPEATRETIDSDGWVHTGDVGYIDESGYVYITDRKKELIITAGGENIAPSLIEGYLRQIPGVNMAMVVGDRQKYLVVLLNIGSPELLKKLEYGHTPPASLAEAITDKHFNEYLEAKITEVNSRLPNVSTVKKYKIVPQDWTDQGPDAELTPTQKLKRRIILTKYDAMIREMYGDQYAEGAFVQAPAASLQQSMVVERRTHSNEAIPPVVHSSAPVAPVAAAAAVPLVVAGGAAAAAANHQPEHQQQAPAPQHQEQHESATAPPAVDSPEVAKVNIVDNQQQGTPPPPLGDVVDVVIVDKNKAVAAPVAAHEAVAAKTDDESSDYTTSSSDTSDSDSSTSETTEDNSIQAK